MHGYVVPSRVGTTLQLEFSVYSGKKNDVKKYVKNLELINKDKKKKKTNRIRISRVSENYQCDKLRSTRSNISKIPFLRFVRKIVSHVIENYQHPSVMERTEHTK